MVLAQIERKDVYVSGLLPIDVLPLSYPSPSLSPFAPSGSTLSTMLKTG